MLMISLEASVTDRCRASVSGTTLSHLFDRAGRAAIYLSGHATSEPEQLALRPRREPTRRKTR